MGSSGQRRAAIRTQQQQQQPAAAELRARPVADSGAVIGGQHKHCRGICTPPGHHEAAGAQEQQQQQQASHTWGAATSLGLLDSAARCLSALKCTDSTACCCVLCTLLQGHPTALVTARESGTGLAAVVNSAMRQFLGVPSAADDVPALLAWWKDEVQHSRSAGQHSSKPGPSSTPTNSTHPAGPSRGTDAMEVDPAAAAAAATPKRQLRARSGAQTPAGKTPGACGAQPGKEAAPLQAPVLVLQDSDSVDAEALEELVVALHEVRKRGQDWCCAGLPASLCWIRAPVACQGRELDCSVHARNAGICNCQTTHTLQTT